MIAHTIHFDTFFQALTDHTPFRWQRRLHAQLRSRQIPRTCDLPTGLGKTSVIPIWMIALANQARAGAITLPRRLFYIVNRRTVVDQATSVVEKIRQRLLCPGDPRWSLYENTLQTLAETLGGMASTQDQLLAVSTLRGELADNKKWEADPARPAIIIGTIDMIGSKLLFSGYGDGRYRRAQHAGLVGQDTLIIHDEAHLTPAFSDLLRHLNNFQHQSSEPRPVSIMELSATSRGDEGHILRLEPEDEKDDLVAERINATKHLYVHEVGKAEVVAKLVECATAHDSEQAKVLIYVRSPQDAQKVAGLINKTLSAPEKTERVELLTGTIRGYERDRLVETSPVYQAFLDPAIDVESTLYLVSTSAGEVGIDMDADHMVCDLTTLESMIQRLGRVNRQGGQGREARVDVVMLAKEQPTKGNPSEFEATIAATRMILCDWVADANGILDVSLRSMRTLLASLGDEQREQSFAPKPVVPPLTDILLDAWSLTTINERMPGRPEVAPYLHGLTTDVPETYVVWRKEVALLDRHEVGRETLIEWFQACRVESREHLRDRADRVKKTLDDLLKEHRRKKKDKDCDFPVVLLNERGEAERDHLSSIVEKGFNLDHRTVVLPVEAGGLDKQGAFHSKSLEMVIDVAEAITQDHNDQRRERWLFTTASGDSRYERLINGEVTESLPQYLRERERITLQQLPEGAEDEDACDLLLARPRQSAQEHAETAKTTQTLDFHLDLIAKQMNRIGEALELGNEINTALVKAAKWHDRGKNRPVWQRFAFNSDLRLPVAKSTKYLHGRALGGYRHEFGSVLEAATDEEIRQHPEADLILHLIAAHHGWARPHFQNNAWDSSHTTAENEEAAAEIMRRFSKLQQRFGRWGLAWLEALVRCADIAASQPDESIPTETPERKEVGV